MKIFFEKFSLLLFSLSLSVVALFYNFNKIPRYSYYSLIQVPFSIFLAIIVYGFCIVITNVSWETKSKNNLKFQVIINLICVTFVYYSSKAICVKEPEKPLTNEESLKLKLDGTKELNETYTKIPKIIEGGDLFYPERQVAINDSITIAKSFFEIIKKPFLLMDSLNKLKFAEILGFSGNYFLEGSEDAILTLKTISDSFKIRNIFYSPRKDILFIVFSFNEKYRDNDGKIKDVGVVIPYIGYKIDKKLLFYKYGQTDIDYFLAKNDDLAYASFFKYAMRYDPKPYFLTKSFWNFKKVKYKNSFLYRFQLNNLDYGTHFSILKPQLEINIKK